MATIYQRAARATRASFNTDRRKEGPCPNNGVMSLKTIPFWESPGRPERGARARGRYAPSG